MKDSVLEQHMSNTSELGMQSLPDDSDGSDTLFFQFNRAQIGDRAARILSTFGPPDQYFYGDVIARKETRARIRDAVNIDDSTLTMMERGILLQVILDNLLGFDCLGPYLRDSSIVQIRIYSVERITLIKRNSIAASPIRFRDENHFLRIRDRLLHPARPTDNIDYLKNTLAEGTEVTACMEPVDDEPRLIIRKS